MYSVLSEVNSSDEENVCGVGISIYKDNPTYINRLKTNSPAYNSGIKSGYIIKSIDNNKTDNWTTEEIAGSITGKCGSIVKLQIEGTDGKIKKYTLTRNINTDWK